MSESEKKKTCFVIGPIGDRHAPLGSRERETYEEALAVLEKVIVPACRAVGLEPIRADQIAAPGEITDQVFRHLRDDDVVIADVSGANANVMYELGLRHSINKLTIQIGEYGQLPFDLRNIRTIQFSRSNVGLIDARKELQHALEVGLVEGNDPVAATRIWLEKRADAKLAPVKPRRLRHRTRRVCSTWYMG
jgi:antitoxin component of RelBE/YafQ-DinJ toxin-antitoxin module